MPVSKVIVIGHSAIDRVYRIDVFPPSPTKVRALEHIETGGGTASNAAVVIARLGGAVELWSRVGDDEIGLKVRKELERFGVDTGYLMQHEGSRTSASVVVVDSKGQRLVISERDHAMPARIDWLPLDNIASAGAVLSDMTWREATEAAFERARSAAVSTVLDVDVAGALPSDATIALTDYAICSADALEHFSEGADQERRLTSLLSKGVRFAAVTMGEKGSAWKSRDGHSGHQAAFPVDVVDTTGAGDAFHGAFAWALACGFGDAECARIAAAVAALNCRRLGAREGAPTIDELDTFLKEQTGRGVGL
jgi:sulfofructose kinase